MECDGNKEVDGDGKEGGGQATATMTRRAMVTATTVAGNKKAMATVANGNKGGGQAKGMRAMATMTATAMAMTTAMATAAVTVRATATAMGTATAKATAMATATAAARSYMLTYKSLDIVGEGSKDQSDKKSNDITHKQIENMQKILRSHHAALEFYNDSLLLC